MKGRHFITLPWLWIRSFVKGTSFSLIILFLIYMGLNLIFPQAVLKVFNFQHFVISSSSMSPVLKVGDVVVIKPIEPQNVEKGMIISFYQDVRFDESGTKDVITHYVHDVYIGTDGRYRYRTKRYGENISPDSWVVLEEELIGVYQFKLNQVGKAMLFFKHPLGLRIILMDVIIIYLLVLILTPDTDEEKEKKKKYIQKQRT